KSETMAVEMVCEAFLSSTFQVIFQRMASEEFTDLFHGKKPIVDLLDKFKIKLKSANALLSDVEQKLIRDRNVRDWLAELKDVTYEAYDLIDKIDTEALRSKMEKLDQSECGTSMLVKFIPASFTEFDEAVKPEIEKTLEKLSFLVDQKYELGLKEDVSSKSLQRLPAPWREKVYGRDAEKEAILKSLLLDDVKGCVSVIPIVGMGGIGKTTLAQLIFNDQLITVSFELRVWVTVSDEFDVYKVMKMIFQKLITCEKYDVEDLSELQCELKKALRGRKFFFVLDDVWNENYNNWDFLKSTFESGARGSKIIVTTRNSAVAQVMSTGKVHKLQEVSNEDCWKLFVDHAFDEDCDHAHPNLQAIGREIVKKCKGLPLAVKSLGGLLHFERDPKKWKNVLKSDVWDLYETQNDEILPALWLSYYYLPSNIKQCFAYCSIFPKDYEFERERLILLWMAEGLLQHKKGKSMEEVGDQYFEDLISRSFFQQSSQHKSSKDATFVMHDLIHDLATFVAGEFCFRLDDDNALDNLATKTRHLSCMTYIEKVAGLSKAESLRTLLAIRGGVLLDLELQELLPTLGCLRVLSVLRSFKLPDSIGNLKHLRYLNLSGTKVERIPDSICTLYNLQTMLLSNCDQLTQLPKNMKRLINLRHLDTSYSPLEEMPLGMCSLKNMQTLTDFVLGKVTDNERKPGFASIKELGELHHLQGKLCISRLQNTCNVEDVLNANLKGKEKLSELALEWGGQTTDARKDKRVLEALRPHINLEKLTICTFRGSHFPNWVGDSSFSCIIYVHLNYNEHCSSLPPLGQLPSLLELEITSLHGVETIGAEFYGKDSLNSTPFPSLELLRFDEMPNWKEWLFIGDDSECIQGVFPRLKELHLSGCPNLTVFLPDSNTIETLRVSGCRNLKFPGDKFYTSLRNLDIFGKVCDSMETLPLGHFPNLNKLRLRGCENLQQLTRDSTTDMIIETLEIKGCKRLELIGNFHYSSVRKLTIMKSCDSLKSFPLSYFPKLNSLELRNCQNLESFTFISDDQAECSTVLQSLSSLKLVQCEKLKSLPEQMGTLLPSLGMLLIEDCPEVEIVPERPALPSSLIHLVISNCNKLVAQHASWDLQRLTSLASLTIEDCDDVALDSFPAVLLPTSLTSLSLQNLPHLKSLNGNAFRYVASLEELWIADCNAIQRLPEEVLRFSSLVDLSIYYCPLLERRYQREGEDWLKVSRIPRLKIQGNTTW
ncbi:NB-ARC domain containing protein, partial [Parasponia andersonii]